MNHISGFRAALFLLLTIVLALAQEPKFEIADVHISPTARTFAQNFGGVLRDGRYVNRDATMLNLIVAAYGVSEDSISGGPGWLTSDLFDVVAKVPAGTTPAIANGMLKNLLAERFKLVIHNGTSPVARYVLTVGKSGSKLRGKSDAPFLLRAAASSSPKILALRFSIFTVHARQTRPFLSVPNV